jgi:hypothetical protein
MAHLPPKSLPEFDPVSQPKTLFLAAPGRLGVLVIRRGRGFQRRNKRFLDAHAALDWCIAKRIGLVLFHPPDPARN